MTWRRRSHKARAEQLDEALDAHFRGDDSGLDELPDEFSATVSRLDWLIEEARTQQTVSIPASGFGRRTRRVASVGSDRNLDSVAQGYRDPVKDEVEAGQNAPPRSRPAFQRFMQAAAALMLIVVLVGAGYGIAIRMDGDITGGQHAEAPPFTEDRLWASHMIQPELCVADAMGRTEMIELLQDVDVDRDQALRQNMGWSPMELHAMPMDQMNYFFMTWQSCRRFGFVMEAKSMESPYFIREDFYGERSNAYHGPVETAYSESTLNEMLDRRLEAGSTSSAYWRSSEALPNPYSTLSLGGEGWMSSDGSYYAVRAGFPSEDQSSFVPSTQVVVFHRDQEAWYMFDIVTTVPGEAPYRSIP